MQLHAKHLKRLLGNRFHVQQLSLGDLQKYVSKRAKEKTEQGHGWSQYHPQGTCYVPHRLGLGS